MFGLERIQRLTPVIFRKPRLDVFDCRRRIEFLLTKLSVYCDPILRAIRVSLRRGCYYEV